MRKYGGSFVKALAEAALRADDDNLRRIKTAWPEYWAKYSRAELIQISAEHVMTPERQLLMIRDVANMIDDRLGLPRDEKTGPALRVSRQISGLLQVLANTKRKPYGDDDNDVNDALTGAGDGN